VGFQPAWDIVGQPGRAQVVQAQSGQSGQSIVRAGQAYGGGQGGAVMARGPTGPTHPPPGYAPAQSYAPAPVIYAPMGAPPGSEVIMRSPGSGTQRKQVLPISRTTVLAGGAAEVKLTPQRTFRVQRLVMDSTVNPSLVFITEFTVGATPQFVSSGEASVRLFAPDSFGVDLRGDTANPGITITLRFLNTGAADEIAFGMITGEAID
jgi:hypothetical protein